MFGKCVKCGKSLEWGDNPESKTSLKDCQNCRAETAIKRIINHKLKHPQKQLLSSKYKDILDEDNGH